MSDGKLPIGAATPPRWRWPSGFAGMLALLLVAEAGLGRAGLEVRSLVAADWRQCRRSVEGGDASAAEILCFGDSLIKAGVVPSALEARLDRPVYNLATLAAPTPAAYAFFRRALASGARPRALVIDANEPQLWGAYYRHWASSWAELLDPGEALRLAVDDGDPGFFGLYLVHYLFPSVRLRDDLRAATRQLLGLGKSAELQGPAPWPAVLARHYRRNRGGLLFPVLKLDDAHDFFPAGELPDNQKILWYRDAPLVPHPTNLVYLDRLLSDAEARGIAVFFVIPPIHPGVLTVRERLGLEAQYLAFAGGVRDRHPNVTVVDGRHAGFDHEVFNDACHMDIRGASAFSQSLAEAMASAFDAPSGGDRWLALPPYARPRARLSVEDLDETQYIVSRLRVRR